MPIHLRVIYNLFEATKAILSSCNRDYLACKPLNIYYLSLMEKFSNPLIVDFGSQETCWIRSRWDPEGSENP